MAELVKSDLVFILQQIQIAEANAAGQPLNTLIPNSALPYGLRTVDGSDNNLIMDQTDFGAADVIFPRLTTPEFRPAEAGTSYTQTSGLVVDSQPRVISNLIVDQTANNPAAVAAAADNPSSQTVTSPGLDGIFGTADDRSVFMIPNVPPDSGLSAPFNQWMTFFGQFFDHGLDLVTKGGSGVVYMPLRDDDPLVAGADGIFGTADDLPASLRFLALTRATNLPGPDGILGTADDIHENTNTTTPFVDQNQTYTSHPSHQVFLRAYAMVDLPGDGLGPVPVDTDKLLENRQAGPDGQFYTADDVLTGGMGTWAVVKASAAHFLGIQLTDADVFDVPLLVTDPYGNFRRGPHGFAMVQMKGADGIAMTADDVFVEGDPTANGGLGIFLRDPVTGADLAARTGHAFLNDIAFAATPTPGLLPDSDHVAGGPVAPGFYDNELLDAHYIAGDGRVNENIGLTTVHSIFHSEHNRQVDQIKKTLLADAAQLLAGGATQADAVAFLNQWLLTPVTAVPADPSTLLWNGQRLFQAARF